MAAIRSSLNVIRKSDQSRHLAMQKVVDVALVLATAALVLLSLGLPIGSRMVARYAATWLSEIGIGEALLTTVATAIVPLVLLVVAIGLPGPTSTCSATASATKAWKRMPTAASSRSPSSTGTR